MAQALAFGTYIPGTTPVHALNAQVKIILACAFSIGIFFVESWIGLLLVTALVMMLYVIARVPVVKAAHGLIPIVFILVFTIVVHAFSISLGSTAAPGLSTAGSLGLTQQWVLFGSFGITLDGLARGLFFALRIVLLVLICSLLTFTSSMMELTDAMLRMFGPLRRFGVPVDDIAMMISIALRFIPTTAREAQMIQLAQKARCANFDDGNLFVRLKSWIPVLIPLFVRLFRRADDLADAMDARCYAGGKRTRMSVRPLTASDVATLVVGIVAIVALCVFL
ncbi:MAG: energy-coupling factor transporter transmembrane component T [Coriobacteriales bacterium]